MAPAFFRERFWVCLRFGVSYVRTELVLEFSEWVDDSGFKTVPGTNQFVPEPNPSARTRFREGVAGTWWSPMQGGEESDRGAGGGSGGEASGGAGQSRSSHSGTHRGSVGRGRAGAGVGGRGLMADASEAGVEQSPVRPASAGGWLGTPSRSRGTAAAVGGSAVSPADMRTVQRSGRRRSSARGQPAPCAGSVGRHAAPPRWRCARCSSSFKSALRSRCCGGRSRNLGTRSRRRATTSRSVGGAAAPVAADAAAPPAGALMAPPRAPGLHETRRRTER